jgi:hypothetical protein
MILVYERLPAYREARRKDQMLRDREFAGCSYFIGGIRVRPMSLRDLHILEEIRCPFLYRKWPTNRELALFLWLLSPEIEKWHDERGWRKQWLAGLEYWQSFLHGRRCRKLLRFRQFEKAVAALKPGENFTLPENSPIAHAIKQAFNYMDVMFRDGPQGHGGGESYFSHLAGWCDVIRSEYKCPESEVMTMPLPKLWQVLRAIQKRKDPAATWSSPECDRIRKSVKTAIKSGRFTLQDFIAGKPKWDGQQWN